MVNCWYNRTPTEVSFIMKLFCSVPFLIVMILIYLYFSLSPPEIYDCSKRCTIIKPAPLSEYENDDEDDLHGLDNDDDYRDDNNAEKSYELSNEFPFITSVSSYTYSDLKNRSRVICAATIISKDIAITTNKCFTGIPDKEELETNYFLRSGSDYWSMSGTKHTILKVKELRATNTTKLLLLYVSPEFPEENTRSVSISEALTSLDSVHTYTWNSTARYCSYNIGMKYDKVKKIPFTFTNPPCWNTTYYEWYCNFLNTTYCNYMLGSPILNEAETLEGVLVDIICYDNHTRIDINLIEQKMNDTIDEID